MRKKTIVFVCRGNISRSPVAEYLLNYEINKRKVENKYEVLSRGVQGTSVDTKTVDYPNISLYQNLWKDIKPALETLHIDISRHISKPIDKKVIKQASIVFAMDTKTQNALSTLFPNSKAKIYLFSELVNKYENIPDPENLIGVEKQLATFKKIRNIIQNGFSKLETLVSKSTS